MKILWVNVGGLWPLTTGGRLRSFNIISELSQRHRVTVLTTQGQGDDSKALSRNLPQCEIMSFPCDVPKQGTVRFAAALLRSWLSRLSVDLWKWRIPALRDKVNLLMSAQAVDLCVADFLFSAPNIPLGSPVPIVFFDHNVEYVIRKRLCDIETKMWRRALLEIEWRKMRRYEAETCRRASLTISVSDSDSALLAAIAPKSRISAVPTGVDTSYFRPNGTKEGQTGLVFTGSMDWYPNEDAILYFMDSILPLIHREMPEVSLSAIGRRPTPRLLNAATDSGVRVTGAVDDVRPYISEAAVYVVPLRVGGGTRLKIFEALAMGKAVVSTTIGAEGLPLIPGEHFIQADHPEEFARATVSLLRDPARRRALGLAGRQLVTEHHSWSQVAQEFEAKCIEVHHNRCPDA
jgi:glycosyltransferase involved in cell wall biosynthesis